MIVYNITTKVHSSIHNEWLQWMQTEHIPQIMTTGCFRSSAILRLLEVDDSEGPTYAIQFKAESKAQYNRYIEIHAPVMRERSFEKWGDKFIAFRSVMQVVN